MLAWFRPNSIGVLLFLIGIAVQALFLGSATYQSRSLDAETESTLSLCFPTAVQIITKSSADGTSHTTVKIHWHWLLLVLASCYAIAMPLGRGLALRSGWRRPGAVFGLLLAGSLALAFLGAIVLSKHYWGYFFARPGADETIVGARHVASATPVRASTDERGDIGFAVSDRASIDEFLSYSRSDHYSWPEARVLIAFDDRGLLSRSTALMSDERLSSVYALVDKTGILVDGETGYDEARMLRGVVVEADSVEGAPLLVVAAKGSEVSNDHYPYYELIFSQDSQSETGWRLISHRRFFFDVAGIEGMEWPWMFLLLSMPALLLSFVTTAGVIVIRSLAKRRSA